MEKPGKPIGCIIYDARDVEWVTRKWVIDEDYSTIPELWWPRDEWLATRFELKPSSAVVEIYPGGNRFMKKVVRFLKQEGIEVEVKWCDGPPPPASYLYRLQRCATIRFTNTEDPDGNH